jgi:hypothetical protein
VICLLDSQPVPGRRAVRTLYMVGPPQHAVYSPLWLITPGPYGVSAMVCSLLVDSTPATPSIVQMLHRVFTARSTCILSVCIVVWIAMIKLRLDVTIRVHERCIYAIVLKGPAYDYNKFIDVATYYLRFNPANTCVVYTHTPDETFKAGSEHDLMRSLSAAHPHRFFSVLPVYSEHPGVGHRNIQRFSVYSALQFLVQYHPAVKWVLQLRSDQVVRLPVFMPILKHLVVTNPISDSRGPGPQRSRLVTSSRLAFSQFSGWCHLDDHFMFGHIQDMLMFWGPNKYWDPTKPFSKHVQKLHTGWRYGDVEIGLVTVEAELCQIFLKVLGKDLKYTNLRVLINDRFIAVRSSVFLFDTWSYHNTLPFNPMASLCNPVAKKAGVNRTGHSSVCVDWESTGWAAEEGGYVMDVCGAGATTYDCTIDVSAGRYSGNFTGDDFYARDEWV